MSTFRGEEVVDVFRYEGQYTAIGTIAGSETVRVYPVTTLESLEQTSATVAEAQGALGPPN